MVTENGGMAALCVNVQFSFSDADPLHGIRVRTQV